MAGDVFEEDESPPKSFSPGVAALGDGGRRTAGEPISGLENTLKVSSAVGGFNLASS